MSRKHNIYGSYANHSTEWNGIYFLSAFGNCAINMDINALTLTVLSCSTSNHDGAAMSKNANKSGINATTATTALIT